MVFVLVTRRLPGEALPELRRRLGPTTAPPAPPAAPPLTASPLVAPVGVRLWDSDDPMPRETLLDKVRGATGLLCLLTDRVDGEVFDRAGPGLKIVSNVAVGYDNVDVGQATQRGIMVTNTPGVLTETTADLAWTLILAACRRLPEAIDHLRELRWQTWRTLELAGLDVFGSTLGVVGAGRIGQAVARRATGFSMKILYHDERRDPTFERETGAGFLPTLAELLRKADVVTLHVPLTDGTRGLIGRREFELMKPTAVLVNTSRGPVVDEAALAEALACRRIFAAGLDVYEREPLPADSPLRQLTNVVLLPHVGSATIRTRTRMALLAVDNLVAALDGRKPPSLVNPDVWRRGE